MESTNFHTSAVLPDGPTPDRGETSRNKFLDIAGVRSSLPTQSALSIDAVRLFIPRQQEELAKLLPLARLKQYAITSQLERYSQFEYRACLLIVGPTLAYWDLLSLYAHYLGAYKIGYLEIALDHFFKNPAEARSLWRQLIPIFRKKYHRRKKVVTLAMEDRKGDEEVAAYWEDRTASTNVVIYSRFDKQTQEPLTRVEWRLRHASHIRDKLGVVKIEDFQHLDLEAFVRKHWMFEQIDYERLGRWVCNIPRRSPSSVRYGHYTYKWAFLGAHRFCSHHHIDTAADLRGFFLEAKKAIKGQYRYYPPSWQRKLTRLSRYKMEQFFTRGSQPLSA